MMMADLKELTLENRDDIAVVLDSFPLTKEEEQDVHIYSNKMFEQIEKELSFTIHEAVKDAAIDHEKKAMRRLIIERIFNKYLVKGHATLEAMMQYHGSERSVN